MAHSSRTGTDPEGLQRGGYDAFAELSAIGRCAEDALAAELMDCMLTARAELWLQYLKLQNLVVRLVARDELCRRSGGSPRTL